MLQGEDTFIPTFEVDCRQLQPRVYLIGSNLCTSILHTAILPHLSILLKVDILGFEHDKTKLQTKKLNFLATIRK